MVLKDGLSDDEFKKLAWFKKWSFWVTQTSEIQPLSDNDFKNNCIKSEPISQAL